MTKAFEKAIPVMLALAEANIYFICCGNSVTGEASVWIREQGFPRAQSLLPEIFKGKNSVGGKTVYFRNS